jgi:hypothetical protein
MTITAEQIPPEVVKAYMDSGDDVSAAEAIAAALNAWPGNTVEFRCDSYMGWDGNLLILPLSTEKNDA